LASGVLAMVAMPAGTTASEPTKGRISAGERAFQKCYGCHALGDTDAGAQGPSLKGIVGRRVAGVRGYDYSAELRAYAAQQPRWTRAALAAFIADPQKVVPDNEMGFFGIRDPAERAALIEYLAAH
ncbi:MAG TPA: c-type cytochrome, partial [Erythrobacter sp.]|nr:c-type cytochrome [Erythrobacter sp.]